MARKESKNVKTQKRKTTKRKGAATSKSTQISAATGRVACNETLKRVTMPFEELPKIKKKTKDNPSFDKGFENLKWKIKYTENISSIGVNAKDLFELNKKICNLLRPYHLEKLSERLGVSLNEAGEFIGLSSSKLMNRKKNGKLNLRESEVLARIGRMLDRIILLFGGDIQKARSWVKEEDNSLKGYSPIELCKTEIGSRIVERHVNKLLY